MANEVKTAVVDEFDSSICKTGGGVGGGPSNNHPKKIPGPHEVMGMSWGMWTATCIIILMFVIVAVIFSILAWNEAQNNRPNCDLTRNNMVVSGKLQVNGEANYFSGVKIDHLTYEGLNYQNPQILSQPGIFNLSTYWSVYVIATPGTNTITLNLPYVNEVKGHFYFIYVAQIAANNTIHINVQDGDYSKSSSQNPSYILPKMAGTADFVQVHNDTINTWHFLS